MADPAPHRPVLLPGLLLALAIAAGLTLTACSTDPAPGTYHGTGARAFEITLVVDDNLTVPEVRFTVTCKGTTISETLTLRPPLQPERGQLRLAVGKLELSGQFERNGARARGSWQFDDCSGTWRAENSSVDLRDNRP